MAVPMYWLMAIVAGQLLQGCCGVAIFSLILAISDSPLFAPPSRQPPDLILGLNMNLQSFLQLPMALAPLPLDKRIEVGVP